MNTVNFDDESFKNTQAYQDFVKSNLSSGILNIRAYAANEAIPISGLRIIVSKNINNLKVVFFEGATDNSGMINQISLPAPLIDSNNLETPLGTEYNIEAIYDPSNMSSFYKVLIYANISVLQNINIVPSVRIMGGNTVYGS